MRRDRRVVLPHAVRAVPDQLLGEHRIHVRGSCSRPGPGLSEVICIHFPRRSRDDGYSSRVACCYEREGSLLGPNVSPEVGDPIRSHG